MNFFDATILHFINGFAHQSWTADHLIYWLQTDGFQKGGLVMCLFWWVWFQPSENSKNNRETLICTAIAVIFAIPLARFVSFLAPFRLRPLHVPDLHLHLAYGLSEHALVNWSSFPSDHAVVFFTFVTGFFFVSRRIGLIVLSYVLLIVILPRVYLGLHSPTDIIMGAVLGVGMAYFVCLPRLKSSLVRPVFNLMTTHPGMFYAGLFFYTYQVTEQFKWARDVIDNSRIIFDAIINQTTAHGVSITIYVGVAATTVIAVVCSVLAINWCFEITLGKNKKSEEILDLGTNNANVDAKLNLSPQKKSSTTRIP